MIQVYIVKYTEFLDDFKIRGDDWFETKLHAYDSLEKANNKVYEYKLGFVVEYFGDYTIDEISEKFSKYENVLKMIIDDIDIVQFDITYKNKLPTETLDVLFDIVNSSVSYSCRKYEIKVDTLTVN